MLSQGIKSAVTKKVIRFFPELISLGPEEEKEIHALYEHVAKAQFAAARAIWETKPHLMFKKICNKKGVPQSSLQRAFHDLNTWTWKPFYEWLQQHNPELIAIFLQQNAEQKQHVIDVDRCKSKFDCHLPRKLSRAYWGIHHAMKFGQDPHFKHNWEVFIKDQCEVLTWAALRTMCREGNNTWKEEFSPLTRDRDDLYYHHSTPPEGGRVYDLSNKRFINLDSEEFLQKFGTTIGIGRGPGNFACAYSNDEHERFTLQWNWNDDTDRTNIRNHFYYRACELLEIPAPEQVSKNNLTQKTS